MKLMTMIIALCALVLTGCSSLSETQLHQSQALSDYHDAETVVATKSDRIGELRADLDKTQKELDKALVEQGKAEKQLRKVFAAR